MLSEKKVRSSIPCKHVKGEGGGDWSVVACSMFPLCVYVCVSAVAVCVCGSRMV